MPRSTHFDHRQKEELFGCSDHLQGEESSTRQCVQDEVNNDAQSDLDANVVYIGAGDAMREYFETEQNPNGNQFEVVVDNSHGCDSLNNSYEEDNDELEDDNCIWKEMNELFQEDRLCPNENMSRDVVESTNEDEGFNLRDGNQQIYPGVEITKLQSLLLVMSFVLRHGLSDEALDDLLSLMDLHCPDSVPRSKYLLYKCFGDPQYEVHFYCKSCKAYLGPERENNICQNCHSLFNADVSYKNGDYFVRLPVKQQIINTLKSTRVVDALISPKDLATSNTGPIEDIIHGHIYRNLVSNGIIGTNDLSLLFNTDGIAVFKSSNYSAWPILCTINELPPHMRKEHIIMGGLWFGKEKPEMNTFLKPFVSELTELETEGIYVGNVERKLFALFLSTDAIARAIVRNSKQFNGAFGCDWCLQEGTALPNGNGPPLRVHPYEHNVEQRTDLSQKKSALISQTTGVCQQGTKGPSILMLFPNFDCVKGICAEVQHAGFLGVTRQFLNTWLDSSNKDQAYYLGRRIVTLDERLLGISPPSNISRCPRSFRMRKYWKASEFKAFVLYSLVILKGVLPAVYLNDWFLFVYGIYHLMGQSLSPDIIHKANACLNKFVFLNAQLYRERHCTFNVHSLCHFAQSVFDCGPLWATSTFVFEGYNRTIGKLFQGTQKVPLQISEMFLMSKNMAVLAGKCIDANTHPGVCKLYKSFANGYVDSGHDFMCNEQLKGLGRRCSVTLLASRVVAVQDLVKVRINRVVISYSRFVYNHQLFSGVDYVRCVRHCNSYVKFTDAKYSFGRIDTLVKVKLGYSCVPGIACFCEEACVLLVEPFQIVGQSQFVDRGLSCSSDFLARVSSTNKLIGLYPKDIQPKCISVTCGSDLYLCPLPCRFYWD